MKKIRKNPNKKLALMIGAALSLGVAFGAMPYDAAEAASYTISQDANANYVLTEGDKVLDTGDYLGFFAAGSKFNELLAEGNHTITINDANTATALSGNEFTLGAGTVLNVKGSSSSATVTAGATPSNVSVKGTAISGSNVDLSSVDLNIKGGQTATVNVSGKVGSINVKADTNKAANVVFQNNVTVGTLSVAEGAKLSVASGTTVKADKLELAKGATVANGASVAVKEIVVDANDANAVTAINSLKLSGVDGSSIKVTVNNANIAAGGSVAAIQGAVINAASGSGAKVETVVTAIDVKYDTSNNTYTVGDTKGVSAEKLSESIYDAYDHGVAQITLDKAAAQAISNAEGGVKVPAGRTMVVRDGDAIVSATPAENATLQVNGTTISADKSIAFKDITVDAGGKKIVNNIEGATVENVTVKSGVLQTKDVAAGNLNVAGGTVTANNGAGSIRATTVNLTGGELAAASLNADTVTIAKGATSKVVDVKATTSVTVGGTATGNITAPTVTLKEGATFKSNSIIKADIVTVDSLEALGAAKLEATDGKSLTINSVAALDKAEQAELAKKLPKDTVATVVVNGAEAGTVTGTGYENPPLPPSTSDEAEAEANKVLDEVKKAEKDLALPTYTASQIKTIQEANPFASKTALPSATDIAKMANVSDKELDALKDIKSKLEDAKQKLVDADATSGDAWDQVAAGLAEFDGLDISKEGFAAMASQVTSAVQYAGKTAAAPGASSARAATVVTNVMTANVATRTTELRGLASAVDEGRPAPDNMWFQYKHTNMDVDNGDVYDKSTVNTNNFQLGYDAKVGSNDYLGAYIGTTTGNVDFRGPAADGRVDIENSYDFGVYGTHMLPADQYIDYMIHTGKFDSKYNGVTWGTKDTGAMVGYGVKIAQNDRLTWNPYIQLAYDKVSVDSYMAGANYIASDDSNNWTAKLGINLLDVSGFYGGLAYSRGLSGSYNAYINGVPMPSQDNNANVLYMSLGYRANMSRNVFLDLNMEKTFADYNGWTAAGKVNFYF